MIAAGMAITGAVVALFSGGVQLLIVPLKLIAGLFACALICLPSLHVFSCLAGARQTLRQTCAALLMGVALIAVLLVGLAPVTWVFSQASSSTVFVGSLHLLALVIACAFGVRLVGRALSAIHGAPVRGLGLWSGLFVLVVLQMTTTLRPLVGPFDGRLIGERLFFVAHWLGG